MDRGALRATDLGIAESDTAKRLTLFLSFSAYHGEGNGNTLQYSCLGNPMHRGAWQTTVHGVAEESDMTE